MGTTVRWWVRNEANPDELRAPIAPSDAARLIEGGDTVTVERSPQRIFPIDEYAAAGCTITDVGTWSDAPLETVVIGLKEPAAVPAALRHRHVFFGHAYKGQAGARQLLDRFATGGGTLFDLEYLTGDDGRRVAAFGYWAGYAGAALAVLHHRGALPVPLLATARESLDDQLRRPAGGETAALVIGALGRSGTGARHALAVAGAAVTGWDLAETRELNRPALLAHDLLVNTVISIGPGTPFLTAADLTDDTRRLTVVSDVTCDFTSASNRLPVYDRATTWAEPWRPLHGRPPLDLIAIDNLPSLLPRESSTAFSADLLPHLAVFGDDPPIWQRVRAVFADALHRNNATTHGGDPCLS
jgi:saccharopine dehydrogenase (NAD+, L-lysine forming)